MQKKLKKINVMNLRIDMHIHEFCTPWMNHPFWRENFLLQKQEDLRQIQESGIDEVWIDVLRGHDIDDGKSEEENKLAVDQVLQQAMSPSTVIAHVSITDELQTAMKICETARSAVISMFHEIRLGQAINAESAGELVESISASVRRNATALVSLARLKSIDDYTYMHSVAVCVLMVSLARQMGLDDTAVHEAGMAGLLHDVGKATTPGKILNKPGKLTDEEFSVMRQHPVDGYRILIDGKGVSDVAIDVCLHHHEKANGTGYPHRKTKEEISLFAQMGAVCDVYDAITSQRAYKAGWAPTQAIRKMAEWRIDHFDERIFHAFVKAVGIYPVGSLVRLSSDRLGVVTEQDSSSLLTPKVRVFFSAKSRSYIQPELVDLSHPHCPEKIVGIETASSWGIKDSDQFWLAG